MRADELLNLLAKRYSGREWAFLSQVRNGTGFAKRPRTADALAMSLWPSRGLDMHGFELKCYRGDWLREKENPEKSEGFIEFCDRWWLVIADESILEPGELPPTWGLLVANPKADKLLCKKEAPKLDSKSIDKLQLAAILRSVDETMTPRSTINQRIQDEFARGVQVREKNEKCKYEMMHRDEIKNAKMIEEFEKASGIELHSWNAGKQGEAVKALCEIRGNGYGSIVDGIGNVERLVENLRSLKQHLSDVK